MADRKISALSAIVTIDDADLLTIVDVSEGVPADQNKKLTMSQLAPYLLTGLTNGRALYNSSGAFGQANTTITELNYVSGVTSAIQGQIDGKISHSLAIATNDFLVASGAGVFVKQTLTQVKALVNYWTLSGSDIYYSAGKVVVGASPPAGNVGKVIFVGASQAPGDYSGLFELSTGTGIYTNEKLVFGIEDGSNGSWIQAVKATTGFRRLRLNPGGGAVSISVAGTTTTINGALSVTQGATFSSTITTPLTASRVAVINASQQLNVSAVTLTELLNLSGSLAFYYTPTLTGVSNIDSTITQRAHYIRFGNIVIVFGAFNANATTIGLLTKVGISLPIASNFGAGTDLNGLANAHSTGEKGRIVADDTNDRAEFWYVSENSGNVPFSFTFMYQVI